MSGRRIQLWVNSMVSGRRTQEKQKQRQYYLIKHSIIYYGWQDNYVLTFFKSRCVLIFHHATPIGNFVLWYC